LVASLGKASLEGIPPEEFIGSFVSGQDRSPIRIVTSNGLVRPVIWTAIMNGTQSLKEGRPAEAQRWLDWAEEVNSKAPYGPSMNNKIDELKKAPKEYGK
jgi:hypothetical protein